MREMIFASLLSIINFRSLPLWLHSVFLAIFKHKQNDLCQLAVIEDKTDTKLTAEECVCMCM